MVAGADEVGRGCFAGSVVAAVVAFGKNTVFEDKIFSSKGRRIAINDSKKLTFKQREISASWIRKNCLVWGAGEVGVGVINRVGIAKATQMAFRKAVVNASRKLAIDYLLIDAFYIPYVRGFPSVRRQARQRSWNDPKSRQIAIINGDEKSYSIAAASIIAKVYRDRLMQNLGSKPRYRRYGWETNKGYGTKLHRQAIKKYGITKYHRKAFVESFLKNRSA